MKQNGDSEWERCQPGMLHEAALERVVDRRQSYRFVLTSMILVLICCGIAYGMMSPSRSASELPRGMSCIQVRQNLTFYARGRISNGEFKSRLTDHLLKCPHCSDALNVICCNSESGNCRRPVKAILKPRAADDFPPAP